MHLCIKVTSRLPQSQLHASDKRVAGDYHFTCDEPGISAEDAAAHGLNAFHYQHAIKVLDDFEIFVSDENGLEVEPNTALESSEETLKIQFT